MKEICHVKWGSQDRELWDVLLLPERKIWGSVGMEEGQQGVEKEVMRNNEWDLQRMQMSPGNGDSRDLKMITNQLPLPPGHVTGHCFTPHKWTAHNKSAMTYSSFIQRSTDFHLTEQLHRKQPGNGGWGQKSGIYCHKAKSKQVAQSISRSTPKNAKQVSGRRDGRRGDRPVIKAPHTRCMMHKSSGDTS